MADKTPSFVIQLELKPSTYLSSLIEKELEHHRCLYNAALGELLKREKQMKQTKAYKREIRRYHAIRKKRLSAAETDKKQLLSEKKQASGRLEEVRMQHGLTKRSIEPFIIPVREHFGGVVNSAFAQKTASRAWSAFEKKLFGKAKRVRFLRKGENHSFEGKSNATGWTYKNRCISYKKQDFDVRIDENDVYLLEALHSIESGPSFSYRSRNGELKTGTYGVKFVRLVRKTIRGKRRYVAQLVCSGYPPPKRDRNGNPKHFLGKGRVGLDIDISSIAASSASQVMLENLAERISPPNEMYREIRLLQRKMDRSKRAMNPNHYKEEGTIKKGQKTWVFSKRYEKARQKYAECHRKLALFRRESHHQMANELLSWGDEMYVEDMRFSALQKRANETAVSPQTGRMKRRKRFGKSIANRAPSMLISILETKVKAAGGSFQKVHTRAFRASQFDHITQAYTKKPLSQRWHLFHNGNKVQRDLYSAFLIQQSNDTREAPCPERCEEGFPLFRQLHNQKIDQLKAAGIRVMNAGL